MRKIIYLLSLILLLIAGVSFYQYIHYYDNKLHLVACNVGQGDGLLIKTPNNKLVLLNAGPDKSIMDCLTKYTPWWLHKIDVAILTDPYVDHYAGMQYVIDKYSIGYFMTEDIQNISPKYITFIKQVKNNHILPNYVLAGDVISFYNGLSIRFIGPSKKYLEAKNAHHLIGESKEFVSVITSITYKGFSALFTGDSQVEGMQDALNYDKLHDISLLQVPSHGSKYGLNDSLVKQLNPKVAIISVGVQHSLDNPASQIISLLGKYHVHLLRTDRNGSIEVLVNANGFVVKKEQ